jgi:hypothetical protein
MELEATPQGSGSRSFGLYPPALFEGSFVYPRYLGIVPLIRLAAPGLPQGYEAFNVLNIYPAGKEDKVELSNTPYSIMLSLAEPDPGNELFMTGRMTFQFKLYKGKDLVFAGSAPLGATSVHDGYSLSFPEFRRMVFTDFIRDYGVLLIWAAAFLLAASWLWWLPVRLVFPRREMLFSCGEAGVVSHSWAEGGGRRHAGVFHEALDIIEANKAGSAGGDL